eukprot:TRINITY_DN712_c0_g1_i1.p1 TRINITY_DN712_c0_g1~~TRINITY_DN712_c0_g1_i1.p1  ORF type:complete len:378 (-),score=67.19 TRINITY_DN712_c0_g1_i1:92-1165(-)
MGNFISCETTGLAPLSKPIRFLFLGMSLSGKSTFIKHVRLIYDIAFTDHERISYKDLLLKNIILGVVENCHQCKLKNIKEKNRRYVRFFKELDLSVFHEADQDMIEKAILLWKDAGFQRTWLLSRDVELQYTQLDYLMENVRYYLDHDYIPSDEDVLYSRQRTTGAYSMKFMNDNKFFEFIDIGGQAPERRKWLRVLDFGVNGILYFAALDEFNIKSSEDPNKTKMEISMDIFKQIINDKDTYGSNIVLVLNKFDLFEIKIRSQRGFESFLKHFPEFDSLYDDDEFFEQAEMNCQDIAIEENDADRGLVIAATYYIMLKFQGLITTRRNVRVLPTCALDRDNAYSSFSLLTKELCNK